MKTAPTYADADADGMIPLKSREHFKFYEPLILLRALNDELRETATYISAAEACDVSDPRQLFEGFLNKVALICDNAKGDHGAKVTAVWVAENEGGLVRYHLTSNQRTSDELNEMVAFVTKILKKLSNVASPTSEKSTIGPLYFSIVQFNRSRINQYLDDLRSEARRCIDQCLELKDDDAETYKVDLEKLLASYTYDRETKDLSVLEYVFNCQIIIQRLISLARSITGMYIESRGRDGRRSTHSDCWSELRHMMSRLLAYRQAVSFFLRARTEWPRLFLGVEVRGIPSSKAAAKIPTRNKSLTANSIVGRLTSKEEDIATFRDYVERLNHYDLDGRILYEFTKEEFHPLVHGEVRMLNHIEFSGGVSPARFFNGWMYIGSSKPTCKLCHYYFLEHKSGVGHRSSHGNLYTNWRFPDVLEAQGEAALKRRADMLMKMLSRVRKDTFNLMRDRATPTHRGHDSATTSARMTLEDGWSVASAFPEDDLLSLVHNLTLTG